MANITLFIPDDIRARMKKYSEVEWSEVVRKAILDYLDKLTGSETLETEHFVRLASRLGVNLDTISLENAVAYYEKMRKMEWERRSMARTSS